jgi:exopolysaccharide biosynthesis polyprenyl glycosylphosphotransferase
MMRRSSLKQVVTVSPPRPRSSGGRATRRGWERARRRAARAVLLGGTDLLAAGGASLLAVATTRPLAGQVWLGWAELWALFGTVVILQPLVVALFGGYRAGTIRLGLSRVVAAAGTVSLLAWIQLRLTQGEILTQSGAIGLAGYFIWASLLLFVGRIALESSVRQAFRRGLGQRHTLIVGTRRETARLALRLRGYDADDLRIVGRISPDRHVLANIPELLAQVEEAVESSGASEVILASRGFPAETVEPLVEHCLNRGVAVSVVRKNIRDIDALLELRRTPVGQVLRVMPRAPGISREQVKRGMDIAISVIGLLLIWPLLLVIAIAIRLDSPGPVLFKQLRAGRDGQPFRMFKFRTMVASAEEIKLELLHLNASGDPRLFKIPQDPRVTRVGRFLRGSSLDELPQLLNVLRGEMSLIGPRPFFPDDLDSYDEHHFERLTVLPGITGLWQVNGRSRIVDFEDVIHWDRFYIRNWSVWLDLKILLKTVPAVVKRTGAY